MTSSTSSPTDSPGPELLVDLRDSSWRMSFPAMGTRVDLIVEGGSVRQMTEAVCELVARHERLWSRFSAHSDVTRLNTACGQWVDVDPATCALLARVKDLIDVTSGCFNPLIEPVRQLWDPAGALAALVANAGAATSTESATTPGSDALAEVLPLCSPGMLDVDPAASWARLKGGARIDLGAIAKGASADQARDLCARLGARAALVSIGTSSIAALGRRSDGTPWRVGIRDPRSSESSWLGYVELPDRMSLSTSGDNLGALVDVAPDHAQRFNHVIDPRSGMPARILARSATVICADGMTAEALSTGMLIGGRQAVVLPHTADGDAAASPSSIIVGGERGVMAGGIRVDARPAQIWHPRQELSESDGGAGVSGQNSSTSPT